MPCSVRTSGVPEAITLPADTTCTWSDSCSASSIAWVVSTTVTPSSRRSRISCQISRRPCGSSPVVGSSRNDDLRPPDDRQRQRQPLLLPAGQPPVRRTPAGAQVEPLHQGGQIQRVGVQRGDVPEHLQRADAGPGAALLEHHADPRHQLVVVGDRVQPEHPDLPGVGPPEALAALHRRGLAGAVGAEHGRHCSAGYGETEAVDRGLLAVPDDEVVDLHRDWHNGSVENALT